MNLRLKIRDLDCIDCARALEHVAKTIEGVEEARVSFTFSTLELTVREGHDRKAIIRRLKRKGYDAVPVEGEVRPQLRTLKGSISARRLILTALCACFLLAALVTYLLNVPGIIIRIMLIAATGAGLPLTVLRAANAIRGRSIDMNVLMSIAIIAAAVIGEWEEAGVVAFLFSVAIILEAAAMARTRQAIEALMDLAPEVATVKRDGQAVSIEASDVVPGEVIIIRPGERIPLEGEVLTGTTSVDESPITGEPMPVEKQPGSQVFAGTLNEEGLIEVSVTKPKEEGTLARIIHLVEHVEESRAPVERFIDRFARIYTPAVIAAAAVMAVIPRAMGTEGPWIYRSLVVLIIACPCALVIATPVAIVSGLTSAAKRGILIKGGLYMEQAARVRAVALDKTGTVTEGRPTVSEIATTGEVDPDDLLHIAATVESASTHPLAGAILAEARKRGIHFGVPEDVTSTAGSGISAKVDGIRYHVAKPEFLVERLGAEEYILNQPKRRTRVAVGSDTQLLGLIDFQDEIRPTAADMVSQLATLGVRQTYLITGDSDDAARAVSQSIGTDEYHANLLPDGKVRIINQLKEEFGTVAMVGDGVNDAPALAAADVGIAMGAAGSDTAIDTADVALMSDDPGKLVPLFRLARSVRTITIQNISVAIAIKAAFLTLAALGAATMWMAVFADMGASLLVIGNALRLLSGRASGPGPDYSR